MPLLDVVAFAKSVSAKKVDVAGTKDAVLCIMSELSNMNCTWESVWCLRYFAGVEPEGLSIAKLTEQPIPEDWNEQRRLYGFPER